MMITLFIFSFCKTRVKFLQKWGSGSRYNRFSSGCAECFQRVLYLCFVNYDSGWEFFFTHPWPIWRSISKTVALTADLFLNLISSSKSVNTPLNTHSEHHLKLVFSSLSAQCSGLVLPLSASVRRLKQINIILIERVNPRCASLSPRGVLGQIFTSELSCGDKQKSQL